MRIGDDRFSSVTVGSALKRRRSSTTHVDADFFGPGEGLIHLSQGVGGARLLQGLLGLVPLRLVRLELGQAVGGVPHLVLDERELRRL